MRGLSGAALMLALAVRAAAGLPATAENGTLRLTVAAVRAAPKYGDTEAPAGRQWFVVSSRWENKIDAKRAAERDLAAAVDVGGLAAHLYLVVDGASLGRLQGGMEDAQGRPVIDAVQLAQPGAARTGDLVFDIPAGAPTSVELRYYEDFAGNMALSLVGTPPAAKAPVAIVRNPVGEFALFGVADPAPGVAAPPGSRAVTVELRARSVWKTVGPAPAYDFSQPVGATSEHINLLDWPGARSSFVVISDGEYACAAEPAGTLPDDARFLPEFFTGGSLVFFVPAAAQSLELVGTLGHAATEAGTLDFPPVKLPVRGAAKAKPAVWTMPLKLTDEMFRVAVGARCVASFAGEAAGEGQVFVVLDVGVENTGGGDEYFQPVEQLQLVDAEGGLITCDEVTARGPHRPMNQLYVPAGARRRFELVFRVATGASLKLNFRGGSFEAQHALPEAKS
jgi:hypothetical protein